MSEPRLTPAPRCAAGAHVHPPVPPARCWLGDGGGFGGSGRTLSWHSIADRLVSPSRATTRRGRAAGAPRCTGPARGAAAATTRPALGTLCGCGGVHWWRWRSGQPDAVWRCWACSAPEGGLDHPAGGSGEHPAGGVNARREDRRRQPNGTLHGMMAAAALGHPVSRMWAGYWHRSQPEAFQIS